MKGIFYSIITVMFVAPLIVFAFTYVATTQSGSGSIVTKTFGDKLASYARSVENDLPRATDIIAGRALQEAVTYVDDSGKPFDDSELRLRELMINGTINNTMTAQGLTLTDWIDDLEQKASGYGFNTDIRLLNLSIKPLDTYRINFTVTIVVNSTEKNGMMRLYRIYNSEVPVSIRGYADPLYSLQTNGIIKRTIDEPDINVFGAANLDVAVDKKFYMASDDGPSFLERLEGRLSRAPKYASFSDIGLETIAYLPELQSNGFVIKPTQSTVDYLYFDSASHPGSIVNASSYNWLRLDSSHATKFGV